MQRFVLAFVILALAVATAGTVPGAHSYNITLAQAVTVNGTQLTPGDYRLTVAPDKVTLAKGKVNVDLQAKVETADKKFGDTTVRYAGDKLAEIRVGGTRTRIVLPVAVP
jgi:hypothetical protein